MLLDCRRAPENIKPAGIDATFVIYAKINLIENSMIEILLICEDCLL